MKNQKIQRYLGRIWIVVFLFLLAIVPLCLAGFYAIRTVALLKDGETISGTVISTHGVEYSRRHRISSPKYTIEYDVNEDGVLESHQFSAPLFSLVREYAVGDSVFLIADPNDPENIAIDRGAWTWFFPGITIVFALGFGGCVAMFLGFLIKTKKLF